MRLKTLALLLLIISPVIYITSPSSVSIVKAEGTSDTKYWALLVCGSEDPGLSFDENIDYMYHVIKYHYAFDDIYLLHVNTSLPEVDALSNKTNVRWAITDWLADRSGPDDVIFIYMNSHGGGYSTLFNENHGGRVDEGGDEGDEGDEHFNSTTGSWFGIDECVYLYQREKYWDDELREDLDTLIGNYSTLIFVRQGCYAGGLIDDLSAPNRIIMTSTSETRVSWADLDAPGLPPYIPPIGEYPDGYSEWSEVFIDALHGEDTYWDQSQIPHVVHEEPPDIVCADLNNDGDVSMWEAWNYALENDDAAQEEMPPPFNYEPPERPWLDDDGNGYPTYINKTDELDEDDGSLANATCLPRRLTVQTYVVNGPMVEEITVWIDDVPYLSPLNVSVFGGSHNVTVQSTCYQDGYEYRFDHWEDNSTSNSRSITLHGNTIIRAYYNETYFGTVNLTVETYVTDDTEIESVMVWIDGEAYQAPVKPPVNVTVFAGPHAVQAPSTFNRDNYKYTFEYWMYWESNSTDNPITLTFLNNTLMRAYYNKEYAPPGGGGGGGGEPGCPFVYAWNGTSYVIDNNVLAYSEGSGGTDVEDYYMLEQTLAPRHDGHWFSWYSLQIREDEQEHSYIDQVRLMAVDHESEVQVAVSLSGEILTYKDPCTPLSVVDNYGTSWLYALSAIDGDYYMGYPGEYLLLHFGDLDVSQGARLVLRDDYKFKQADPGKGCIHVQTIGANEEWVDIAALWTRKNWATEIVDLSDYLPDGQGELKVRLYFTGIHKIDYVGLDTTEQDNFDSHNATLVLATHSTQGWVRPELLHNDSVYAELLPGERIELTFILPKNSLDTRTFIICSEGRYYTIN